MSTFTRETAEKLGRELGFSFDKFTPEDLRIGMEVELEHGSRGDKYGINVTGDDPKKTAQIALAHLVERGDYYDRLEAVEGPALIITPKMLVGIIVVLVILILIVLYFGVPKKEQLGEKVTLRPQYRQTLFSRDAQGRRLS